MLAKINYVGDRIVKVTKLDIDNYGSVIPLKELELKLPKDESIIHTLEISPYAAIFTENEDDDGDIILAKGITDEELNGEKERIIAAVNKSKES